VYVQLHRLRTSPVVANSGKGWDSQLHSCVYQQSLRVRGDSASDTQSRSMKIIAKIPSEVPDPVSRQANPSFPESALSPFCPRDFLRRSPLDEIADIAATLNPGRRIGAHPFRRTGDPNVGKSPKLNAHLKNFGVFTLFRCIYD